MKVFRRCNASPEILLPCQPHKVTLNRWRISHVFLPESKMNRCNCHCLDNDYEYDECEECGFQFCEDCELPLCISCEHHRLDQVKCPMCADPCVQMDGYILCRTEFEIGLSENIIYCRTCSDFVDSTDNTCRGHDLCTDTNENEMIARTKERVLVPNKLVCFRE